MADWISTIWSALFEPDERFLMHRYHSSRLALVVGVLMLGAWTLYDFTARGILRCARGRLVQCNVKRLRSARP